MSCSLNKSDFCCRFLLGALSVGLTSVNPASGQGCDFANQPPHISTLPGQDGAATPSQSSGQVLNSPDGNLFMEELPSHQQSSPEKEKQKLVPDLSTVNVPVDPNGHIVPLINKDTGPVLPFYSKFEETVQPLWQFAPAYPYAYPLNPYIYPTPYYYPGYQPLSINFRFRNSFAHFGLGTPVPYGGPALAPINPWFTPPLTPVLPNF